MMFYWRGSSYNGDPVPPVEFARWFWLERRGREDMAHEMDRCLDCHPWSTITTVPADDLAVALATFDALAAKVAKPA